MSSHGSVTLRVFPAVFISSFLLPSSSRRKWSRTRSTRFRSRGPSCLAFPGRVQRSGHQVQTRRRGLFGREMPPRPDRAAVARVKALDRVRRADHRTDLDVVLEERHELRPSVLPQPDQFTVTLRRTARPGNDHNSGIGLTLVNCSNAQRYRCDATAMAIRIDRCRRESRRGHSARCSRRSASGTKRVSLRWWDQRAGARGRRRLQRSGEVPQAREPSEGRGSSRSKPRPLNARAQLSRARGPVPSRSPIAVRSQGTAVLARSLDEARPRWPPQTRHAARLHA